MLDLNLPLRIKGNTEDFNNISKCLQLIFTQVKSLKFHMELLRWGDLIQIDLTVWFNCRHNFLFRYYQLTKVVSNVGQDILRCVQIQAYNIFG